MKKRIAALILAAAMAAGLVGCGGGSAQGEASGTETKTEAQENEAAQGEVEKPAEAAGAEGFDTQYTWTLSCTYSTGSPAVLAYEKFAELLSEYSGGAITLNVFADSALMGENDSFVAVKSGELEFCGSGLTTIPMYNEEYGFILAPFLVDSWDSFMKLYNSDIMEEAREKWRTEQNTRGIGGMAYRGYRNMSSNQKIETVEDLKGVKLRMNSNQMWSDVWNSIGATSVPIALGELYTSIQNGAVDASEGPWEQMKGINLEEVQDYIIETKHTCNEVGIWMSESLYQSLPANYQEVIDKAAGESIVYLEELAIEKEDEYKQQLIDGGCEFVVPELDGFREKAEGIWNEYFEKTWTVTTLEEVQKIMSGN